MPNVQTTTLNNNLPSGSELPGSATGTASFYGGTPIVQPTGTSQSAVATTAITTLATTPTATDIAVAVNSLIARVAAVVVLENQLRSDLVSLNLLKGSA